MEECNILMVEERPLTPRAPTPAPLTPAPGPSSNNLTAIRTEMADFKRRFDQLMQMITNQRSQPSSHTIKGNTKRSKLYSRNHDSDMIDDDEDDEDDDDDSLRLITQRPKSKKWAQEEESLEDDQRSTRRHTDLKGSKEPNVLLPDPFDGNPKNLKIFLNSLDLCF